MVTTRYSLRPRPRWTSGALTCVALFAFGGLLLWGLFRAPRSHAPASPDVRWAVPTRPLRVASLDIGAWTGNPLDAAKILNGIDPDVVLAQRVPGEFAAPLAEALGMERSFHPRNFVRLGRGSAPGCLVLCKHPLYDATPLRPESDPQTPLGVWAAVVMDGRRFAVASADAGPNLSGGGVPGLAAAALLNARQRAAGNPPIVAAFRSPPMNSAKAKLLETAGLADAIGEPSGDGGPTGVNPIVAIAGRWRVRPAAAGPPRAPAPGILWVEVGPE